MRRMSIMRVIMQEFLQASETVTEFSRAIGRTRNKNNDHMLPGLYNSLEHAVLWRTTSDTALAVLCAVENGINRLSLLEQLSKVRMARKLYAQCTFIQGNN